MASLWVPETSSGYHGMRNIKTGEWVYYSKYIEMSLAELRDETEEGCQVISEKLMLNQPNNVAYVVVLDQNNLTKFLYYEYKITYITDPAHWVVEEKSASKVVDSNDNYNEVKKLLDEIFDKI